jgi:hypothetical protein
VRQWTGCHGKTPAFFGNIEPAPGPEQHEHSVQYFEAQSR